MSVHVSEDFFRLPPEQRRLYLTAGALRIVQRRDRPQRELLPHQKPPDGDWDVWLLLGGRGSGKTEAGARYVDSHARGPACLRGTVPHRIAIVAPSHDDAVDTCVRGETGLLQANPTIRFRPGASLASDLTWTNGAEAKLFGTFAPEDVERFRGPQHCLVWGDEFAAWRKLDESWDMIAFGLRLGEKPRIILTTTPKRRGLLRRVMDSPTTAVTTARTSDNPGLPPDRLKALYAQYGGTPQGRQELEAEIVEDAEGALWERHVIESLRLPAVPDLTRIVVAIDPSATSTESADECGIVVAGIDIRGHGYVLDDLSMRTAPHMWASRAIEAFHRWKADCIVAETNNGGEMVEAVLRGIEPNISYKSVVASRGKRTRAEPISNLYHHGKVHHVGTDFELLEDQMCSWVPDKDKSPDRMDALVWALTELMTAPLVDNPWAALQGQRVGAVA